MSRFLHLVRHGEAGVLRTLTDRGERQARLVGRRLAALPIAAVHHSPLPRAVRTAQLIGESLPGVPLEASDLVGDYVPPVPDLAQLPEVYARFLADVPASELATGAALAAAAVERFAAPSPVARHEVIVTHNFCVGWFVREALAAPDSRWLDVNVGNAALTTIVYRTDRRPSVLVLNDMGHLPDELRWTGFPPELHV